MASWNGHIVPSQDDYAEVEREYPDRSPAEKTRLAQAAALIRLLEAGDGEGTEGEPTEDEA